MTTETIRCLTDKSASCRRPIVQLRCLVSWEHPHGTCSRTHASRSSQSDRRRYPSALRLSCFSQTPIGSLIDHDGRVLTTHVRSGDGAMMAAAPAMVGILLDLLAGISPDDLRGRAKAIMRELERHRRREPGKDE